MDTKDVIKALLALGIQLLGKFIPVLAGFLGGPLGFLAGWAISFLSGLLYDWVEKLARYASIDHEVHTDIVAAKAADIALVLVQNNKDATEAEHAKAIADFTAAVSKLGRFKLH